MIRKMMLVFLSMALILVGGCWDLLIIEDLALALSLGVDEASDPELALFTITNPAFSETAVEETKKIAVEGYSLASAFYNMQKQRGQQLVLGQVSTLVFSEEAARSGLMHQVLREVGQLRDMSPNAYILVVRGAKAQDVLFLEPPEEARVARYLTNLLERSFNGGLIPRISASRYWVKYSTVGRDPVVPIIELTGEAEKKQGVNIAGLAAFDSEGKMQGVLTDQETILAMLQIGQNRRTRFSTKIKLGGELREVSLFVKDAQHKHVTAIEDDNARIAASIKMEVDIVNLDYAVDALDARTEKEIETLLARDIQGNMMKMIAKTQSWGTDILGVGQCVRIQHPQWFCDNDWSEKYKDSEFTVEVQVNVKRIGTLINPKY